jgi:hypothetical protein
MRVNGVSGGAQCGLCRLATPCHSGHKPAATNALADLLATWRETSLQRAKSIEGEGVRPAPALAGASCILRQDVTGERSAGGTIRRPAKAAAPGDNEVGR